jgi:hypothetical protein
MCLIVMVVVDIAHQAAMNEARFSICVEGRCCSIYFDVSEARWKVLRERRV